VSPQVPHPDAASSQSARIVDSRGRPCPMPIIDLARAAAGAPPGAELRLLADDPAAPGDVAAWCRMRGHTLLETQERTGRRPWFVLRVRMSGTTRQ
jgi:TusA-related sulfurtransferase